MLLYISLFIPGVAIIHNVMNTWLIVMQRRRKKEKETKRKKQIREGKGEKNKGRVYERKEGKQEEKKRGKEKVKGRRLEGRSQHKVSLEGADLIPTLLGDIFNNRFLILTLLPQEI